MEGTMRSAARAAYIEVSRARALGMPLASRRSTWRASDGGRIWSLLTPGRLVGRARARPGAARRPRVGPRPTAAHVDRCSVSGKLVGPITGRAPVGGATRGGTAAESGNVRRSGRGRTGAAGECTDPDGVSWSLGLVFLSVCLVY
jgi:hypothetical protein